MRFPSRLPAIACGILLLSAIPTARAAVTKKAPASVFEEFQKKPEDKQLWLTPEVTRETPARFAARLEKAARLGDPKAQASLGLCYLFGFGVPRDLAQMVHWTETAAAQGHAGAQNNLGQLYDEGSGVPHDAAKAHELYLAAAGQGLPNAQFNVGCNYAKGIGVEQSWPEAALWYRKAHDQGYLPATNNLANIYLLGRGVPVDFAQAEKLLRKPAEAGLPVSQFGLGAALIGLERWDEAGGWIRQGAVGGYAGAQFMLATLLDEGHGMPRDRLEALRWARRAADAGLPDANALVARFLYEDPKPDEAEILRRSQLAAEGKSARGYVMMGFCFLRGTGVARDPRTAADWFRRADAAGHVDGALNLGLLTERGSGVPRDYVEAARLYRKAADLGSPEAQWRLGLLYRDGSGVKTDLAEAARWLRLAAAKVKTREVVDALAEVERQILRAPDRDAEVDFRRALQLTGAAEKGDRSGMPEAVTLLEKAAASGNAHAKAFLAGLYRRGDGVTRDVTRSDALIAELAGTDDVQDLTSIGLAYLEKREQVPPDAMAKANGYFRKAALRGFPPAQNALGFSLMVSETERDPIEAFKWLLLAERKGIPEAKVNLLRPAPLHADERHGGRRTAR